MFPDFPRSFLQALALSLLIHALLLAGVVIDFPDFGEAPAATIRVSMGKGRQDDAAKATPKGVSAPEPVAAPTRQTPAKVLAQPNQLATPVSGHESVAVSHAESPEARKTGGGENRAAGDPSASAPANKPAGDAASAAREGISPDDMRQYRMALASAMRRFKRYPAVARDRGWEGTAQIGVTVSVRPAVPEVLLVKSSGHGPLDEQALEMVSQAVRVTQLPEGLKSRSFRVVLPVQFSLENE